MSDATAQRYEPPRLRSGLKRRGLVRRPDDISRALGRRGLRFSDGNAVDLEKKLAEWEHRYNYSRPHGAHSGITPSEARREKLR